MFINLNAAAVGIRGLSFSETAELAARHGFGGIDCPVTELGTVEASTQAGEHLRSLGLQWGLFGMPFDVSSCSDEEFERGMGRLVELLPLVRSAGCTRTYNHIWPGSGTLASSEYAAWLLRRLTPLVELLGSSGVQYGLEFLGPKHLRDPYPHPSLYTLREMTAFLKKLPSTAGIVLDSFHWYTSGGTLDEVRTLLDADRIVCVHLNDARTGRAPEEQLDMERDLPGATGVIDLSGLISTLRELGYEGPVIAEPFSPQRDRLGQLSPDDAASEVARVLRGTLGESSTSAVSPG